MFCYFWGKWWLSFYWLIFSLYHLWLLQIDFFFLWFSLISDFNIKWFFSNVWSYLRARWKKWWLKPLCVWVPLAKVRLGLKKLFLFPSSWSPELPLKEAVPPCWEEREREGEVGREGERQRQRQTEIPSKTPLVPTFQLKVRMSEVMLFPASVRALYNCSCIDSRECMQTNHPIEPSQDCLWICCM